MRFKIETEFDDPPIERKVGEGGTSGRIYVPKAWIGDIVTIIHPNADVQQKAKEADK